MSATTTARSTLKGPSCAPIRDSQVEETVAFLVSEGVPIGGARSKRLYRFLCRQSLTRGQVSVVTAVVAGEIAGAVVAIADQRRFWRLLPLRCPAAALEIGWRRWTRRRTKGSAIRQRRAASAAADVSATGMPPPNLWKRSDNSVARVQYIAVAEKVRGKGVGAALYESLMTELGDKGVRLVEASIAAHNSSSIRLHRRSGWTLYSDGRRVLAERRLERKVVA